MPPQLLVDLDEIDLSQVEVSIEGVRECNAQRYEMEQINGIIKFDTDNRYVVAYKNVRDDEFWVRGHIPGRPLLPGVLMAEAAAQACTYYYKRCTNDDRFLGFGGLDKVKFRGTVVPGDRLIIIAKNVELKRRRAVFETQGVVDGRLVFEGIVTGMPV
ncbi:MAG: beta-hydroxyacyl-ACP dehydratase [Planctomycetes bacterium]|nr:beta-hydroxyacyl-ACP dehydratase [Planctomycetota bacterium]